MVIYSISIALRELKLYTLNIVYKIKARGAGELNYYKNNKLIDFIIAFIVVFSSTTGWYLLDYMGMKTFWGIFFICSSILMGLVFYNFKNEISIKAIFKSKFNIVVLIYFLWISFTYLANYQGKSSLLYIFKIWFIMLIYFFVLQIYFSSIDEQGKKRTLFKIAKYIYLLGIFNSLIAVYQFLTLSNSIFGIIVTDWPSFNPASMYGNVNGLGTYLFISIISGFYYMLTYSQPKFKPLILFGIFLQCYMLYLTVARTSIVAVVSFIILSIVLFMVKDKTILKQIFNRKNIWVIILANLIFLSMVKFPSYRETLNSLLNLNIAAGERSTEDLLKEKNDKGLNHRDIIWKAVLRDYKEYVTLGDGLKYNIINKIDVANTISEKSRGVDRISYHNTLFRYFASNGLLGLILFIAVYAFIPLNLLIKMIKRRELNISYCLAINFFICIFMYMQMEEVYIGEIGLMPLITVIFMSYSSSLIKE